MLALPIAGALQAQAIKNEPPKRHFTEAEIEAIELPALAFEPTAEDVDNFDKYFYFHRAGTSFEDAFADVIECDALSSGSRFYAGINSAQMASTMVQYGALAGGAGGVLGSVLADAIVGSSERRRIYRVNVRNCMFYKGYSRYGLPKNLWEGFNFAEGNGREDEDERQRALLIQARVASAQSPQKEALEP